MSSDGTDRSIQKLTALAVVGMVILALAITGGSATYAYLSDGETLGTANDPNVIAAGNLAPETVTPSAGNTAPTPDGDVQDETKTDTTVPTETPTPTGTPTTTPTETPTTTDGTTQSQTDTDTPGQTDTDTPQQTPTESGNSLDSGDTCAGNTGVGNAGNAGNDCTTASMLVLFGVPAVAAVRREYTLSASRRGR